MSEFRIRVESADGDFPCESSISVLTAMQRANRHDISVGCQGGGCGACRIQVIDGTYEKRRMSRTHVSEAEEELGYALACRIKPTSALLIRVTDSRDLGVSSP